MSKQQLEQLDDQGLAAWDAHDGDAFLSLLADDFVWYDWTLPEPMRDKEAARAYFDSWGTAFPDMKTTMTSRIIGDGAIATELEYTGTNTGPMAMGDNEIPPTGKSIRGRGAYMARVRDGKIVEFRTHPDLAGVMMQLGLMPDM